MAWAQCYDHRLTAWRILALSHTRRQVFREHRQRRVKAYARTRWHTTRVRTAAGPRNGRSPLRKPTLTVRPDCLQEPRTAANTGERPEHAGPRGTVFARVRGCSLVWRPQEDCRPRRIRPQMDRNGAQSRPTTARHRPISGYPRSVIRMIVLPGVRRSGANAAGLSASGVLPDDRLGRPSSREATTTRARMRSSCEPTRFTEGRAIGSNGVADSCTVERDGIPDHRGIDCRPRP